MDNGLVRHRHKACPLTKAGKEMQARRNASQRTSSLMWAEKKGCWEDKELADRFRDLGVSTGPEPARP